MAFADILLHIDSYPDPTPLETVDEALTLAARFGGKVTALAVQVAIPVKSNLLAEQLVGLTALAAEEEARSLEACRTLTAHVSKAAAQAGVASDAIIERVHIHELAEHVARRARTRDVCIVPVAARFDGQGEVAQRVIFSSGRPALVFKSGTVGKGDELGTVVVAWDGGRFAARAMADALPILIRAKQVRILTIVNEKPSATAGLAAEAVRHLATHGVKAVVDEVDAKGRAIGPVLDRYLEDKAPDLFVMGAYGHSRLRELILGGATERMLQDPSVPVFLSH